MTNLQKTTENQEIEITAEMIRAVQQIIEGPETFIVWDREDGHRCDEEDARKIIQAVILARAV